MKLLLTQAGLPIVGENSFDWKDIVLTAGLHEGDLLKGTFIEKQEDLTFMVV